MSKFLLMGGRSTQFNGKSKIYEKMIDISPNNNIFYIPYASSKHDASLNKFISELPSDVNVIVATEDMLHNKELFEEQFKKSGIIFVSGGIYNDLICKLKENDLISVFFKYLNEDKVYAGVSAGAILYSKYGMGDKDVFIDNGSYYNFKMVEGLGLVNITICPHYQKEELVLYDDVAKLYPYDGYALEDDTALFIFNDKIDIIKDTKRNSLYKLTKEEDYKLTSLYERN